MANADEPINLTLHDIVVYDAEGQAVTHRYPTIGRQLRMVSSVPQRELAPLAGGAVPVWTEPLNDVVDWPAFGPDFKDFRNKPIIVSSIAAKGLREHSAPVYVPDTAPDAVVRGARGEILGVKRLFLINVGVLFE